MRYTGSLPARLSPLARYFCLILVLIFLSATVNAQSESNHSSESLSEQLESIANKLQSIEKDSVMQSETIESLNEALSEAERQLLEAEKSAESSRKNLQTLRSEFDALNAQFEKLQQSHESLRTESAQTILELTEERDAQARNAELYRRIAMIGTPAAVAAGVAIGIFITR